LCKIQQPRFDEYQTVSTMRNDEVLSQQMEHALEQRASEFVIKNCICWYFKLYLWSHKKPMQLYVFASVKFAVKKVCADF